jgi:NAD+ synthase
LRQRLFGGRASQVSLPLVYLNRVGGQDELAFDGSSMVFNADGERVIQMRDWEEQLLSPTGSGADGRWSCETATSTSCPPPRGHLPRDGGRLARLCDPQRLSRACSSGLSGGIDSALSAAVAVDALGPDKVWGVMMPSPFTSRESLEDAEGCAGCSASAMTSSRSFPRRRPVADAGAAVRRPPRDLAEENVQARLRMVTLMALSNKFGHMLLTTGNKSEMSVGYATLYGDMAGGYSVLKDAYKTTVFALSHWRNGTRPDGLLGPAGAVMPERVITKPPSAELRPDQKDEDSLPPYAKLDTILHGLIDRESSVHEVAAETGSEVALVAAIEKMVLRAEYKRRQSPPGVKLGGRNFGRDRRYPITNAFRTAMIVVPAFAPSPTGRLHVGNIPPRCTISCSPPQTGAASWLGSTTPTERSSPGGAGEPRRLSLAGALSSCRRSPVGPLRPVPSEVRTLRPPTGSMLLQTPEELDLRARCCMGRGCRPSTSVHSVKAP